MSLRRVAVFCTVYVFVMTTLIAAQESKPKVEHVPARATSAASGKEMFKAYCASCHGESGKGDGPAAAALKAKPSDLSALAKSNGGKFPADRVQSILHGQATLSA